MKETKKTKAKKNEKPTKDASGEQYVSGPKAAALLGISYAYFNSVLNNSKFEAVRAGRQWMVPMSAINEAIEKQTFHPRSKASLQNPSAFRFDFSSEGKEGCDIKIRFDADKLKLVDSMLRNTGINIGEYINSKVEDIYQRTVKRVKEVVA